MGSTHRGLPLPYLGAALLSRTAEEGAPVVIVLLALDRTGDAWLGGLLVAATTLPHVVTGPLGGRLRDRTGRPIGVTVVAALTVAVSLMALAALTGQVPWPLAALAALVAGTAGPLLLGGLSSLVGGLVSPERRHVAHALDSTTYNVAGIGGPALGAVVAAAVSPAAGLYCLGGAAALGAGFVVFLPTSASSTSDLGPGSVLAGFRWIWRTPILRVTTVVTTLAHGGLGGLAVTAPLLAVQLDAAESTGGFFLSMFAAGAAAGSLTMTHRRVKELPEVPLMLASLALMAAALAFGAFAPVATLAACCFAVAGFADGPLLAMTLHVRTAASPLQVRTQVFMAGASLKLTFAAAGSAICGIASDAGGRTLLAVVAAVVAGSILPGVRHWNRRGGIESERGRVAT